MTGAGGRAILAGMAFLDSFLATHRHQANRACHAAAAACFLAALPAGILRRRVPWGLLAVGGLLIGLGHAAEGELPAALHALRERGRKRAPARRPARRRAPRR